MKNIEVTLLYCFALKYSQIDTFGERRRNDMGFKNYNLNSNKNDAM